MYFFKDLEILIMDELKSLNKLPTDLVRYVFEYLDFVHNTYVIRSGKRLNKLILVQRPLYEVIPKFFKMSKEKTGKNGKAEKNGKNRKNKKMKDEDLYFIT